TSTRESLERGESIEGTITGVWANARAAVGDQRRRRPGQRAAQGTARGERAPSPLTSGAGEKEKKGPGRGGGEGDDGAADLDEQRTAAQVLSSARQKKGARAAIGNQTALQRGIRNCVSVHDSLQHQRSLLELFLESPQQTDDLAQDADAAGVHHDR